MINFSDLYAIYEETDGVLDRTSFERYVPQAIAQVRRMTNGKTMGIDPKTAPFEMVMDIKRAVIAVIEECYYIANDVASESNDGVSVTYRTNNASKDRRLHDAAAVYLDPYGLLYRGI